MTRTGLAALTLLMGCSFIDDFDKFEARREGSGDDAGARDAGLDEAGRDGSSPDAAGTDEGDAGLGDGSARDAGPDAKDAGETQPDGTAGDAGEPGPDANPPPSCTEGGGSVCSDGDPCTEDGVCDPSGACAFPAVDRDGDGYAPGTCASGSAVRGGDCDDGEPAVHPGVSEQCDGIDNDCNGDLDDGLTRKTCYRDRDGDGYVDLNNAILACTCPSGTREVTDLDPRHNDCWDDPDSGGDDVNPAQTRYFDEGYGTGSRHDQKFDYDCDGSATGYYELLPEAGCGGLLGLACEQKSGFTDTIPPCGESDEFTICGTNGLTCSGRTEQRKQLCR